MRRASLLRSVVVDFARAMELPDQSKPVTILGISYNAYFQRTTRPDSEVSSKRLHKSWDECNDHVNTAQQRCYLRFCNDLQETIKYAKSWGRLA